MPSLSILDSELTSCANLDVLLCVPFGPKGDQFINIFKSLQCRPYLAVSAEDALKKLRYNSFNAVVITSGYSTEVVNAIVEKPMSSRRNIFYVYIDTDVETSDPFLAFALSANLVINANEIEELKELFEPTLLDYNKLYRVFYNVQKSQEQLH